MSPDPAQPSTPTDFPTWLKQQMDRYGWTQTSLGAALKVAQVTVSQWLAGKNRPDPENANALARLTNTDPVWLAQLLGHLPGKPGTPPRFSHYEPRPLNPLAHEIMRYLPELDDESLLILRDQIVHTFLKRSRAKASAAKRGRPRSR